LAGRRALRPRRGGWARRAWSGFRAAAWHRFVWPAQAHAGQGRVCRPVAAVCSSAPQCLEPLPPPRIVEVAPQDHHVHLLAAIQHGCARSEQKHESAQAQCVGPLGAVASRSAARAIRLFNLGHQMRPSPMVGNGVNKRTVASCETCFDEATRA